MIRHFLAALVAAFVLTACEDIPEQVDPNCVSNCDPGETDDTGDPPELVNYAARTTINGTDEPCQIRYQCLDCEHVEVAASGTNVELRDRECYALTVGTATEVHTRPSDGVRFVGRPTVVCFNRPDDPRATTQWSDQVPLDPYYMGWFTCEITSSEPFQTLVVETEWKEWSYEGEWDVVVDVAANCLDFGGRGLHCFDGAGSVKRYGHSGDFLYESDSGSVELTPNSFNYSGFNDDFTVSCVAH